MVGKRSDGLPCKNEARGGLLFVFFLHCLFLDFEKLGAGPGELAAEAVAVEAEVGEGSHQNVAGFDQSDGVLDVVELVGKTQKIGFHGSNAVNAPREVGEGADEVELAHRLGIVLVEESLEMDLIKLGVLAGDDGRLAGEPVAESVQRRSLFPFRGARTGGFLGIQAIDVSTSHSYGPLRSRIRVGAGDLRGVGVGKSWRFGS